MRKSIMLAVTAMFLSWPASAETLKGGYPGCISAEYLGQFYDAVLRNDDAGLQYLLEQGVCVQTKNGVKVSVLETDWGKVRVRVYKGKQVAELWTSVANIQP